MSQTLDLCICATQKTRGYREQHNNVCPTCNKMMVELDPDYSEIPALKDNKQNAHSQISDLLIGLTKAQGTFGSVKERATHDNGVKLKPPTFSGKNDPKHFFVKLLNYLETYKIGTEEAKIRVLKSCLEDSALDLYLSLDEESQSDLQELEKTFVQHYTPLGHSVIETEKFMKIKKEPKQSVSEFHTLLKKKAN